jgi:hypothetical protein
MDFAQPWRRWLVVALLVLLLVFSPAAIAQSLPGRLDFLKSKDSTFALFANTSATLQPGKQYPNEVVLITGLPSNPTISARVDLGLHPVCQAPVCAGIRSLALSPDGDTALATSDPDDNHINISTLFLLRNIRAFVKSRNPADLKIRTFRATEFPDLENVSGLAFGPDGTWAVANTIGRGPIDLTYQTARGTVIVITGLPDNPVFSPPFAVPMHSQGNIDLSVDGETLLLNDVTDRTGGVEKNNVFVLQGIGPGGRPPRMVGSATIVKPQEFPAEGTPVVKDARLTVDGKFVISPVGLIREFDSQGLPVGLNQIVIYGPIGPNGKLGVARLLTEADGVEGGPYYAAVSPDGGTALIVNDLDIGGAKLLTGLGSGDPTQIQLKPLPFPFFGPPFPLGPNGPPVLASHVQAKFTPDGETALVANWIIPPLANAPLSPSVSVLTGFQSGNIHVVTHLTSPTLNTFDFNQIIATVPSGLEDYINLYVPASEARINLNTQLNTAIVRADRGDPPGQIVEVLANFTSSVNDLRRQGVLTLRQADTLNALATVGMQAVTGRR